MGLKTAKNYVEATRLWYFGIEYFTVNETQIASQGFFSSIHKPRKGNIDKKMKISSLQYLN